MNQGAQDTAEFRIALMVPGQGSQFAGMGKVLAQNSPTARGIIELGDEVLGYPLSEIMAHEDPSELNRTVHTQPAVFIYSMALFECLRESADIEPVVAAGHSLGEYSALTASGMLSFEEALSIIKLRAISMDEAQPPGTCGMAAVLGVDVQGVMELMDRIRENDIVEAANFNAPGQVVISGHLEALNRAMGHIKDLKGARGTMLQVSSAFHTPLMESARSKLDERLRALNPRPGRFPVIANINGKAYDGPDSLADLLSRQITNPVLWSDCINAMAQRNPTHYVEIGPGKVLTGLMRRINRKAKAIPIASLEDAQAFTGNLA